MGSQGGSAGGARSRSARAVAQQAGGCYVLKCSEDSRGSLLLHLGSKTMVLSGTLAPLEVWATETSPVIVVQNSSMVRWLWATTTSQSGWRPYDFSQTNQ